MTTSKIHPARQWKRRRAFTLMELLGVIVVIGILAGITLGAAGAVRRHATMGQTKAEIAALEAACARYQADTGSYPTNASPGPDPTIDFNPRSESYRSTGTTFFTLLFGTNRFNSTPQGKRYFEPKPSMVSSTNSADPFFVDPWGNPYGIYSKDGTSAPLIWSTVNQTNAAGTNKWITSWPRN